MLVYYQISYTSLVTLDDTLKVSSELVNFDSTGCLVGVATLGASWCHRGLSVGVYLLLTVHACPSAYNLSMVVVFVIPTVIANLSAEVTILYP